MSHEVENMFTVKQKAWHGLGKVLETAPSTSREAITLAGLDWDVEKRDVYWKRPDNQEFYKIPDRVSLVRISDQKPLSIVSDHYKVLQNSEAFDFFDPIIRAGKATYETAGSLCGGRVIWVLANLNRSSEILKSDEVRRYLLLSNSHGFNKSIQIMTSAIRVVCMNTLNMALASGGAYGIWHQGNIKDEMEKIKDLLGLAEKQFEAKEEIYKAMTKVNMTNSEISEYIMSVIPPANKEATDRVKNGIVQYQEHIWSLMENGTGSDIKGVRGTLWGAYNAFVEHVDYYASPRTRDRANYIIYGTGKAIKDKAYSKALEIMG